MVAVARQINQGPRTAREWDAIQTEIVSIQRLSPQIWYGEYLRNKVAEVRASGRLPLAKAGNLVVRGTEPDETQNQSESRPRRFPRLLGKSRAAANAGVNADASHPQAAPAAAAEMPLKLPGDSSQAAPVSPPEPNPPVDLVRASPRSGQSIGARGRKFRSCPGDR